MLVHIVTTLQRIKKRKMGQSLKKFVPGSEEQKAKEIGPIIKGCYDHHFANISKDNKSVSQADFHRAVCKSVEEINKELGYTQFRVPEDGMLRQAFVKHSQGKAETEPLGEKEFRMILEEVIKDTRITGAGAKDTLIYIFGVPLVALLIKQRAMPKLISNDIFIPCVTSATVFALAKLKRI